jgi:SAM-dependent methyltransferase
MTHGTSAVRTHGSSFANGQEYEQTLGPGHKYYIEVKARELIRLVSTHAPGATSLLDLGCGTGELEEALPQGRFLATGVDVSEGMIRHARGKRIPGAEFLVRDAASTRLPTAAFDLTVCTSLFHHLPEGRRAQVVQEMIRVTRPGGMLAVFEHNPWNPATRVVVRRSPVDQDAELLRPPIVRSLFEEAGARILDRRFLVFFPRPLRAMLPLERRLGWCPLGAQYVIAAMAPDRLVRPARRGPWPVDWREVA